MSNLDKLMESLPKDFKLDLSKMKDIVSVEKKYEAKGFERIDHLDKLGSTHTPSNLKRWFAMGYSECGQDHEQLMKDAETCLGDFLKKTKIYLTIYTGDKELSKYRDNAEKALEKLRAR